MENYVPPYTITDKMTLLISEISCKIGKINNFSSLQSRPHLRKNNMIRSVHSSLAIEANSLTLSQVRDVIDEKLVVGNKKEIQEVKNAYDAYEMIEDIDPFSVKDLKNMHGVMTKYLLDDSGKFRKGEEGVFCGDKCIFMAPPAKFVPSLIDELFAFINQNKGKIHPLILSSVFHYEFLFIHPFSDGNGRMARLWHTAFLYGWNDVFEFIPIESQIEKYQSEYYDAISSCHKKGDSNDFIEFMLKVINEVIDELTENMNSSDEEFSVYVKKLLSHMEYGKEYSTKEMMEILNLKSRVTFRKYYLLPAIDNGFILMTMPDKVSSKNQKYYKK